MERYQTNDAGDVYARWVGGSWQPFERKRFGWASPGGRTTPAERRTVEQLVSLPPFKVALFDGPQFVPGSRPERSTEWCGWADGAAPPAAARSRGGANGTLAYSDRLTAALGLVAQRLPAMPERSPFLVNDFVGGR
jgi:hypothetical protein